VAASYAGPDTEDATVSLPADVFAMTVFSSKDDIIKKPDVSSLTLMGERVSIPKINFGVFLTVVRSPVGSFIGFWFLGCYAATQLALRDRNDSPISV